METLKNFGAFRLCKIGRKDLAKATEFALCTNYQHHLNTKPPVEEIEAYIKEDHRLFDSSHFYATITDCGKFFGSISACLWNGVDELAFEREYNLNIKELIKKLGLNPPQVWHVGRLAIDRQIINENPALRATQGIFFKKLITHAFAHICTHPDNLAIAECDRKLHSTLVRMGIASKELSAGHIIWGSEALPILNTGTGVQAFVEKHKHLLYYNV